MRSKETSLAYSIVDLSKPDEITLPYRVSRGPISYMIIPADTTLMDSNLAYSTTGLTMESIAVHELVEVSVVGL